ncbi:sigma-70 family RNA polymerase sigma factor [Frigoriglobus tundricola]|uniref:Uncharacterized protein n=1 Tax=Frigoriglobus tundricola TaxID=2774151 RepID=A0A6M5Z2L8_9BACT|nr:sigma-70 family RNA polymerase sigma factor [Frigoriglobus tundricola]QJX00489.1 hypothetical protein FTUN_8119 [Frigoriglobus tundricola]
MNTTLARFSRLKRDSLPAGDGPLLDAFLAGDQAAFAALVHRHAGLVFATCRRVLRHQQDAEDAFQATFLVLARRAADVWPREAVSSWLFGVAHRVALKARAVRGRRAGREQPLGDEPGAERPAPDFDLAEAVHRVVLKLPAAYRAAVVACDLEGLSRRDAAERLGWSEGTLSGRLARARALLADRLRGTGLALPATGLAALLANGAASAAAVQITIDVAIGTAGAAPAPVAALAEGVVRSMALFKLKAMTAAVFVACALGFGAFASTGIGDGAGAGGQPKDPQGPGRAPVPLVKAADPPKRAGLPPAQPVTDRDRLQGTWRVVALTEGDGRTKVTNPKDPWIVEVTGNTLRMPYEHAEGGWKQREYVFSVTHAEQRPDSIEHPATIDLDAPNLPVRKGIYEFTAPVGTCISCHTASKVPRQHLGFIRNQMASGICGPGLQTADLGVRLALSADGKRPAKFTGDGVIVLELTRAEPNEEPQAEERARLVEARKRLEAALRAAIDENDKAKIEAELELLRRRADALLLQEKVLRDVQVSYASMQVQRARAQAELAQVELAQATANLQAAKVKLAAAEKALADAKKPGPAAPAPDDKVLAIHIRTLTAAEKVIQVKATGNESILDILVHIPGPAIKPEGVSVWVVRDEAILPVDLVAITKRGEVRTNYQLKAGDRLFLQAKPSK